MSALSAAEATAAVRDVAVVRGAADQLEAAMVRRLGELHEAGQSAPRIGLFGAPGTNRAGQSSRPSGEPERWEKPEVERALGKGRSAPNTPTQSPKLQVGWTTTSARPCSQRDQEIVELAVAYSPEVFRRRLAGLVDVITDDDGLERAEQRTRGDGIVEDRRHHRDARVVREVDARARQPDRGRWAPRSRRWLNSPSSAGLRARSARSGALDRLVCGTGSDSGDGTRRGRGVDRLLRRLATGRHDRRCVSTPTAPRSRPKRHGVMPVTANISSPSCWAATVWTTRCGARSRAGHRTPADSVAGMYRTCAIDGCDRHFDTCHMHHIAEWDDLGFDRPRQPDAGVQLPSSSSPRRAMATGTRPEHPTTHRHDSPRRHALRRPRPPHRTQPQRPARNQASQRHRTRP